MYPLYVSLPRFSYRKSSVHKTFLHEQTFLPTLPFPSLPQRGEHLSKENLPTTRFREERKGERTGREKGFNTCTSFRRQAWGRFEIEWIKRRGGGGGREEEEELLAENGPRSTLPTTANSIKFRAYLSFPLSLSFVLHATWTKLKELKERSNRIVSVSCERTAWYSKRKKEKEREGTDEEGKYDSHLLSTLFPLLELVYVISGNVCYRSVVVARAIF